MTHKKTRSTFPFVFQWENCIFLVHSPWRAKGEKKNKKLEFHRGSDPHDNLLGRVNRVMAKKNKKLEFHRGSEPHDNLLGKVHRVMAKIDNQKN